MVKSRGGDCHFTRKEIRDFSGWSDWNIRKALEQLEKLEYLKRVTGGGHGNIVRYELLVDPAGEAKQKILLTSAEELEKAFRASRKPRKAPKQALA